MKPNKDIFRITKETPLENGGVEWEVEYTDEFKELYKRATRKKRAHEKSMAAWMVEMITLAVKQDDNLPQKS